MKVILLLFLASTHARRRPAPSANKLASDAANKEITFIEHGDVNVFLSSGIKFLFFGAEWCPMTQKMDPKYLAAEKQLKGEFNGMKKVECSVHEDFCVSTYGTSDGYPTINMYQDGVFIQEFPDANETNALVSWVRTSVKEYRARKAAETEEEERFDVHRTLIDERDGGISTWFGVYVGVMALVLFGLYRYWNRRGRRAPVIVSIRNSKNY
jgi:hypothetical protein